MKFCCSREHWSIALYLNTIHGILYTILRTRQTNLRTQTPYGAHNFFVRGFRGHPYVAHGSSNTHIYTQQNILCTQTMVLNTYLFVHGPQLFTYCFQYIVNVYPKIALHTQPKVHSTQLFVLSPWFFLHRSLCMIQRLNYMALC